MTETTPHRCPGRPPHVPTTMRATTYDRYGSPEDVLRVTEVPVPRDRAGRRPRRGASASVNALDWHFTTGLPMFARPALGLRRPHRTIPGADVAGVVVAVGARRHPLPGRRRGVRRGQRRRLRRVRRRAGRLAGRASPRTSRFEQAATIGVAAETALQGLRDWGRLRGGPAGAGQRCVRRRRHVRRPAGQGARCRPRHRGVQHRATSRPPRASAPTGSSTTPARTPPPRASATT